MRYVKIVGLLFVFSFLVWGTVEVKQEQQRFNRLHGGFEKIQKNLSPDAVLALMGTPDLDWNQSSTLCAYWNDDILTQSNSQIKREFRYETFQFFLPRSFVIGFNEKDEVVAKHFLD